MAHLWHYDYPNEWDYDFHGDFSPDEEDEWNSYPEDARELALHVCTKYHDTEIGDYKRIDPSNVVTFGSNHYDKEELLDKAQQYTEELYGGGGGEY